MWFRVRGVAEINDGYQPPRLSRLLSFNDVEVRNITHLAQLMEDCQDDWMRFRGALRGVAFLHKAVCCAIPVPSKCQPLPSLPLDSHAPTPDAPRPRPGHGLTPPPHITVDSNLQQLIVLDNRDNAVWNATREICATYSVPSYKHNTEPGAVLPWDRPRGPPAAAAEGEADTRCQI